MTRGVPEEDESPSYIHWPVGWQDTGEGGLAVFLIVPEDPQWSECAVGMPTFEIEDVIVSGQEQKAEIYRDTGLRACLCLGTTGGSYYDDRHGYFKASLEDLTPDGEQLYMLLKKLYGRSPVLLTLLDT